jgi:uncharacterized repeat protein (TIGR03803 family)
VLAIFAAALFVASTWAAAQEKVLHNFNHDGTDGWRPEAGLIFDAAGNLYGTTSQGGSSGVGTVFELTPATGGTWTEKVLHSFGGGADGGLSRSRVDLGCRRQSLRHDPVGRHFHRRGGVRVDARSGRNLDGEGAA